MNPEIDWLDASARYLAGFYGVEFVDALTDLSRIMETMRETDEPTWTSFRSHILIKHVDEDWSVEWLLARKDSSLTEFSDGSKSLALAHSANVRGLPGVLDGPETL